MSSEAHYKMEGRRSAPCSAHNDERPARRINAVNTLHQQHGRLTTLQIERNGLQKAASPATRRFDMGRDICIRARKDGEKIE
jgi:hypothetical protein